jgi:hypothetical protein
VAGGRGGACALPACVPPAVPPCSSSGIGGGRGPAGHCRLPSSWGGGAAATGSLCRRTLRQPPCRASLPWGARQREFHSCFRRREHPPPGALPTPLCALPPLALRPPFRLRQQHMQENREEESEQAEQIVRGVRGAPHNAVVCMPPPAQHASSKLYCAPSRLVLCCLPSQKRLAECREVDTRSPR